MTIQTVAVQAATEQAHLLAAAQAAASPEAFIGTVIAILLVVGAWYAKKHKGWDLPQMIYGFFLAIAVGATAWGGPVIGGIQGALQGVGSAFSNMLS